MTGPDTHIDLAACFDTAFSVYRKNAVVLIGATIIFQTVSFLSLGLLAGPLLGGYCVMMLRVLDRRGEHIDLNDLFCQLGRFFPFVGLFFLQSFLCGLGLALFLLPGIVLSTFWLYSFPVMAERRSGVFSSLSASTGMVRRNGFFPHMVLSVILHGLIGGSLAVPGVGLILYVLLLPYAIMLLAAAYRQQAGKETGGARVRA